MKRTRTTTWPARIAVVLVLLASGMASGATGLLSGNSPLGKNTLEGGLHRGPASVSAETHQGCADSCWCDAAGLFVAPRGGRLTVDPTGTYSASERAAAQHMADLGHDVTLRPPTGTRAGGGTSDLLVDGVRYDVYTPTTGNPSRIIGAIAKKNSQAEGVVLDLSGTTVTQADLGNVLARVQGAGGTNIRNIVVIGGR